MTSTPRTTRSHLASAEQSSEAGGASASRHPQHQTQQAARAESHRPANPPSILPSVDQPPRLSRPCSPTGIPDHPPSESSTRKRRPSLTELRDAKDRRLSHVSIQPSLVPAPSSGAQVALAPQPHAATHSPSLPPPPSPAPRAPDSPALTRESQGVRRLPGRPRKNAPNQADTRSVAGANDADDPISGMSSSFAVITSMEPPRLNVSTAGPYEARSTGSAPSSRFGQIGASSVSSPSFVTPSPSFSGHRLPDLFLTGPHSALSPSSPSRPSASQTQFKPREPLAPGSPSTSQRHYTSRELLEPASPSGPPYGAPGFPIPPPPYQILPPPRPSVPYHGSTPDTAETDGYMIIPNAVNSALIREVVGCIEKGLPVIGKSETGQTYATPLQAFRIRDEFISRWLHTFRPFYEPMGKAVPKMPVAYHVGSFLASDPKHSRMSLLQVNNKNQIYVHIALSPLSRANGFYHILTGSHHEKHPARTLVTEWSRTSIDLKEGDAFIWRGDLFYFLSPKGGGHWQCLEFDWGPGLIDLTD